MFIQHRDNGYYAYDYIVVDGMHKRIYLGVVSKQEYDRWKAEKSSEREFCPKCGKRIMKSIPAWLTSIRPKICECDK